MHKQLFIADLHLDPRSPETYQLALHFLQKAQGYDHLYLLGDIFEYWLGDDVGVAQHQLFIDGLQKLSPHCQITVMLGNRDFLMGDAFASAAKINLCTQDELLIDLGKNRVLLMHGDTLCTEDHEYQQFRRLVRDPDWQTTFLKQSPDERVAAAEAMRKASKEAGSGKKQLIMDVHLPAVDQKMADYGVDLLIHGHTHRPDHHKYTNTGTDRWVVGDWHNDHAKYVEWDGQQLQLKTFTAEE